MKTTKVFKTANNEILIVEVTTHDNGRKYVAVTANCIAPLKYSDAVERNREMLEDDDYLWKEAVAADRTQLGFEDWVEMVINSDGETCMIDTSLYPYKVEIDGEDYIFDSVSCGCLHDDIKAVTKKFNQLIKMHLKGDAESIEKAEKIIASIKTDNVDEMVEKYAIEIINN